MRLCENDLVELFSPEFEDKMLKRLRTESPGDDIKRTPGSRGGDILHIVKESGKVAGTIICSI